VTANSTAKKAPKGKIQKSGIFIAKNYLNKDTLVQQTTTDYLKSNFD